MKKIYILTLLLCFTSLGSSFAQTLKGHIYDANTNEPLVGAAVAYKLQGNQGVVSDIHGAYEIKLPEGGVDLAHVVALFQQLCLQQLLQRLRGLGDEVGVRIGRKCDFQRVHLLYIGVGRSLRRLPGAAAGQESGAQRQAQQKCGNLLFHGNPSSLIFCAKQNGHAPHQHIPVQTFTQMLMPPLPPGKPGAVGPYWDPLSLEHRLPRNLVLVIYVSVAPGSSPFRRIP